MCLALIFPYSSDSALRAVTPGLLRATGLTLVLNEVPWSTRGSGAAMQTARWKNSQRTKAMSTHLRTFQTKGRMNK